MQRASVHKAKQAPGATGSAPTFAATQRFGVLQRRSDEQSKPASVPPIVHDVLRSPGEPLDAATRAYMEPRFGHDFGKVRVHAGPGALTIGKSDDSFEREANHIADRVMRMSAPQLQRPSARESAKRKHVQDVDGHLQAQRVEANDAAETAGSPIVHETLRSSGQPFDSTTREFMESRFGHDFSHVRVHADMRAAESARAVKALAYTVGQDVVFDSGLYAPASTQGRHLLGHELSHVLQQTSSQLVQRQKATAEPAKEPSGHTPELGLPAQSVPATDEPNKLRIANVQYDTAGHPIEGKPLSDTDKKQLGQLLEKLRKDDPSFYATIENDDVLVTRGALPGTTVGLHLPTVMQHTLTLSAKMWFFVEHGGIDLPPDEGQVLVNQNTDAWKKAEEEFTKAYTDVQQQRDLDAEEQTRVLSARFSAVLILDLEKLQSGDYPQTELATLRHEAGHFLFLRNIQFDKLGNAMPTHALSPEVFEKVKDDSFSESIKTDRTDMGLLGEYAAEGVEDKSGNEGFDLAKFKEENDPGFGLSGYHDVDGTEQKPAGYGARMARGLTLLAAKQIARDLMAVAEVPVFLRTVLKPERERRTFDVLMLMGADKKSVSEEFDQLKKDFPVLATYKRSRITAY